MTISFWMNYDTKEMFETLNTPGTISHEQIRLYNS